MSTELYQINDWKYCCRLLILGSARVLARDSTFAVPDTRPLSPSDLSAANRRHDEMQANSPWFRLWQRYRVCCRSEAPVIRLPE